MFARITKSPSKTLLALLSAFVAGVFLHAWDERMWLRWFVWCVAGVLCVFAAFFVRRMRLVFCILAAFLFALARYDAALITHSSPVDNAYHGVVASAPQRKGLSVLLNATSVTTPEGASVRRMVLVLRAMPDVHEGDAIAWRCVRPPTDQHPACIVAGHLSIDHTGPHPIEFLRVRLRTIVRVLIPEPDASLLLGLLIGDRDGIPSDLVAAFRHTGTSHVLAASGYNVTLVVEAAVIFFALIGFARRRAAAAVAFCIVIFATLCGGDPPVVRAAIMGSTGLLATTLGRRYHAPNALMLAAACMLALDPAALRHDAGFRLSFAAVAGLRAFGKPFAARLKWIPWDTVRNALSETLGAIVATLPLILHDFGILAISSPFVNVAIVPIVPFAMATGAAAIVAGTSFVFLGIPFAFVAAASLRLMRWIVMTSAALVPAFDLRINFFVAAMLYGWIVLLWYALRPREDSPSLALAKEGVGGGLPIV